MITSEHIEFEETWAVVFRKGKPFAAFITTEMAHGWIKEAKHRRQDTISVLEINFKGIKGYQQKTK